MKSFRSFFFTLAVALGPYSSAQAKLVQILHTNDLHSYFSGTRTGDGGYARLKTVIDELKNLARSQNIPTLYLDGGDFGEGSSFYFSNHGVDSIRALDLLGVDVTVLGNHDFILGSGELKRQIKEARPQVKIISANIFAKRFLGLNRIMPDYADFDFDGLKVRVFGLTTSELHYHYPLRPRSFIKNSHNSGIKQARKAAKDGVDYTIALTHIGLERDIELAEKSRSIDLIVGGHSHILLPRPEMVKNLNGRPVPVLQAGAHGLYVGSLLVDMKPKGESTIVDYRMYNVTPEISENTGLKEFVNTAYLNREQYFNRNWDEVIGFSEINLSGNYNGHDPDQRTCWSHHMARLTRLKAKTDLGIQFDVFQGERISAGPIRFGDIIDNFPHFRKWGDRGWKIQKALVSGFVLKKILDLLANSEFAFQATLDGAEAKLNDKTKVPYRLNKHNSEIALINGAPISNFRYYTLAMPSEIPYALLKTLNIFAYIVLNNLRTVSDGDYWPVIEDYIKKNSPLRCIDE